MAYLIDAPVWGHRIYTPTALPQRASAPPNKSVRSSLASPFRPRSMHACFAPNSISCACRSKTPSLSCTLSAARRATCTSPPSPTACLGWVPYSRAGARLMKLIGSIGRCRCSWSCSGMEMGAWRILLSRPLRRRILHLAYSRPPGVFLTGNCRSTQNVAHVRPMSDPLFTFCARRAKDNLSPN